ncbi:TasA family protein [Neobacillus drentensis]|uniref:TasA family protein n=1 Tax=Neobacillus drentensis TaxID=220684 RepID=UPI0030035ED3
MGIKKRLAGAALAAGIGVAAISGGTFALFTAGATNTDNTFAAGTVKLGDLTGNGNVFSSVTDVGNMAPGDERTGTITVKNTGSLDAWVTLDSAKGNGDGAMNGTGDLFDGTTPVTFELDSSVVKLAPGGEKTFNVKYLFSKDADNSYQGATGTVTVKVKAVQARNNTNGTNDGPTSW